jgi:hypothetical protein
MAGCGSSLHREGGRVGSKRLVNSFAHQRRQEGKVKPSLGQQRVRDAQHMVGKIAGKHCPQVQPQPLRRVEQRYYG